MKLENFLKICKPKELSAITGIAEVTIRKWQQQIKSDPDDLGMTRRSELKLRKGCERLGITLE